MYCSTLHTTNKPKRVESKLPNGARELVESLGRCWSDFESN